MNFRSAKILSRLVITISFLVVIALIFVMPNLISLPGSAEKIKINAVICVTFIGFALIVFEYTLYRYLTYSLLFTVMVIAGYDLLVNLSYLSHQLDFAFFWNDLANTPLARRTMSEMTSTCFLLFAIGLHLSQSRSFQLRVVGQLSFHLITVIAFVALLGYLLSAPQLYGPLWLQMSFTAASALFILSIAASFLNHKVGITGLLLGDLIGNKLARRLFPVLVVCLVIGAYLRLLLHELVQMHVPLGIALLALVFMLSGLFLIWRASLWLNSIDLARNKADAEIKRINEDLEKRIQERTAELKLSYEKLEANEKRLRANERVLRGILENTNSLVFFKDTDGKFQMVNRSFEEHFKIKSDDLKLKTDFYYLPENDALLMHEIDQKILADQQAVVFRCTHNLSWGTHSYIMNKFPVFDENEKVSGVAGIATDITELIDTKQKLRKMNEELEANNRRMQQFNEYKDRFLAVVSHDLRNPLAGILNITNAMWESDSVPFQLKDNLDFVRESGKDMMTLLNNLLDLNKIESGTQVLNMDDVHISHIFKRIFINYSYRAEKKDIQLKVVNNVDTDVIHTDAIGLYRCLENLVSNAIKFSAKGTQVTMEADHANKQYLFSITDHGPGIPDNELDSLFNLHAKLSPRPTDGESSTGLGLSIVKDWVTLIGGEIHVKTKVGNGSVFQIILPERLSKL